MSASLRQLARLFVVVVGAWRRRGELRGRLAWECDRCKHRELVQEHGYAIGDSEPCVHCEDGTSRVVPA